MAGASRSSVWRCAIPSVHNLISARFTHTFPRRRSAEILSRARNLYPPPEPQGPLRLPQSPRKCSVLHGKGLIVARTSAARVERYLSQCPRHVRAPVCFSVILLGYRASSMDAAFRHSEANKPFRTARLFGECFRTTSTYQCTHMHCSPLFQRQCTLSLLHIRGTCLVIPVDCRQSNHHSTAFGEADI